jgi:enoyl-CoA hydratase/carnithine racemase
MNLQVETLGRVRRLTLASPATKNLITVETATDLLRELHAADSDPAIGCILIDAEGQVFCSGMEWNDAFPTELFTFGRGMTKPVIVSMRGVALSAGVALMANAHIALAAQGSSFGLTDIREGRVHPDMLTAVSEVIGRRRMLELALTGRVFTIPEALSWGFIHASMPAFELDDRAIAVAQGLSNMNADALRAVLAAAAKAV